jgi:hypothetical protein
MIHQMDRQLRNVALLTLAMASLAVAVPILLSESPRTGGQTALLVVALVGAGGSLLALVLASTPWEVLKRDLRTLWSEQHTSRWSATHEAAQEPSSGASQIIEFGPDITPIRAEGMPCGVVRCTPRSLGLAEAQMLKNAEASCTVERRSRLLGHRDKADVPLLVDITWGTAGRWPNRWFDSEHNGPIPGRYSVLWQVRFPDGQVDRPRERFRVKAEGVDHVGRLDSAWSRVRDVIRHYRGLDQRQKNYT